MALSPRPSSLSLDKPRARGRRRVLSLSLLIGGCLALALPLLLEARASGPVGDFSKFSHTSAQHARLPCLLCHTRAASTPRPSLPGHARCAGCHAGQFADPASPICTICHTSPQSGAVKSFPPLRTFNATFDHAKHARGAARPRAGCAACHTPVRGGVALSIPARLGAHSTCFQCHTPRAQFAGRDISSCGTCHRVGRLARTPTSAPAYRVNFSHAEHAAADLGCADCHAVRPGMPRGRQVTSPLPSQHHASRRATSCMTCHDNKRAFGGDDFSDCKRCHEGNTWRF
jgi:c(7)-type cytochrome triheme protein